MKKQQFFLKLEQAWTALKESYVGLSDAQLLEPGVMGEWSVKDILAHVTTWEEEALKYLPLILTGGRPPRYIQSGGIDTFNAQRAEQKRDLALSEVLRQLGNAPSAPRLPAKRVRRALRTGTGPIKRGHRRLPQR